MDKIKKILVEFSRIMIGCVFIFSGFVKAVDPLGSAYKFHDYFNAFGMPWMDAITLPASFILSAIEFSLGVCILLAVYRKFTSFMILAFMIFMTSLTLYSAIANPVSDCGCFGDALILSNWATFYKNIVFLAAAIVLFLWNKMLWPVFSAKYNGWTFLYSYVFILGVSLYCYNNLPILDFRPYKIGTNIPNAMIIPEGVSQDEYETTFIYKKDGVEKEFTLENYPSEDSTWTFVDSKSKLIKQGYKPPIHDFTITASDGADITDLVLQDTSYTFLLISYKLEKADDSNVDVINEIFDYSQKFGYKFYCLTASGQDGIQNWIENTGAEYPICTTDETTLKTIIRSNPGLMLLKHGNIINKWHHSNIPADEKLNYRLNSTSLGQTPPNNDKMEIAVAAGILVLPLILIFIADHFQQRKKKNTNSNQ